MKVVYDDLVAAVGSERSLNGLGNSPAGIDVANNSAILSVVAVAGWLVVRQDTEPERARPYFW